MEDSAVDDDNRNPSIEPRTIDPSERHNCHNSSVPIYERDKKTTWRHAFTLLANIALRAGVNRQITLCACWIGIVFYFVFVDNLMIRDANLSHAKKEANSTSHVYSTSTSSNNGTLRKQQIHFRTYGNHLYAAARERIVKEANGTGWFNTVKSLSPDNLSEDFKEKYRDVLALERGGGYWIWKFDIIEQAMEEMQEGDFLVYLDSGRSNIIIIAVNLFHLYLLFFLKVQILIFLCSFCS